MRNIFGGNNSIYKLRGRKIYSGAQGCPTCFSLVPRKQSNNGNTKKIPIKTRTNKTTTVKQKKNPNKQNWKGNISGACVPLSICSSLVARQQYRSTNGNKIFLVRLPSFLRNTKANIPNSPKFSILHISLIYPMCPPTNMPIFKFLACSRPLFHLIQFGYIFVPVPMFVFGRPDRPRNGLGSLLQIKTVGTSSSSEHISLKRVKMVSGGEDGRVVKKWIYVPGDRPAYRALSSFS